jgi:predicted dehydrogenase
MKTSLVVGMGIGNLYAAVLDELGHGVITVDSDPNKNADFTSVDDAIKEIRSFDTVHICTPNFTHIKIARKLAACSKIVFIEKPGVATSDAWKQLSIDYPKARIVMVKNNQYRDEIKRFKELAVQSKTVHLKWNNCNRIPSPGSWFTDKSLAFGGVSRDLIPHMLSYYCALTDHTKGNRLYATAVQRNELKDIDSTDYGVINYDGVYNVDDFCEMEFKNGKTKYILTANWRTLEPSDISVSFDMDGRAVRFELGLCPESAYKQMIRDAVENLNNDSYWQDQLAQDIWIHEQIENL